MRGFISLFGAFIIGFVTPVNADSNFTMKTPALSAQGTIPVLYTCDGKNISPEISWINTPPNTKAFAFILSDPDAPSGTFYHWVLYNIPKEISKLEAGIEKLPTGTLVGKNSWDKSEYGGPCPPKGARHQYYFSVYALDSVLSLPSNATAKEIELAVKNHSLQQTAIIARYR